MRRSTLVLFALVASAAPASAQFEGTVTARITDLGGANAEPVTMKMSMKGDKQVTVMTIPSTAGPMAGAEMRMIVDPATNMATTLIPLPAAMAQNPMFANAKGMKTVIDLSKADNTGSRSDEKVDVKKLGTREKIAGYDCDDYEITSANGNTVHACITQSLGRFVFPMGTSPMGGRRGGNGSSTPAWAKAFGGKPFFPLKVWSSDGKMAMEVTSVDRAPVSASLFEIPDGYMDMGAMMRNGRP